MKAELQKVNTFTNSTPIIFNSKSDVVQAVQNGLTTQLI